MPRVGYSTAQKREAVALARVAGVEAAAESLGIDPRTVRKWSAQAGDRPELDGSADGWQRLLELAQSRVAVALAADKVRPKDAAVIAAIAERNLRDLERDRRGPMDASQSAVAARVTFFDWLTDTVVTEPHESEQAFEALDAAIDAVVPELLLRRANAEADSYGPPSPHRTAILAWFSGRPEFEARDVLTWAQDAVVEVIAEHGSLVAWHAFQQAEDDAEKARREAEYAVIQARATAMKAEATQASPDSETRPG